MTNLQKGLILAGAQLALVASLAAKYAMDRARLPRSWVQTVAYDPNLPIRGRYLSLQLRVSPEDVYGSPWNFSGEMLNVTLKVRNGHLVANPAEHPTGLHVSRRIINRGAPVTALMEPVAFFLPEHAMDPSVRSAGEELWMEVTVPKTGPPRPIQLAIKRGDSFTPLGLK
ncbi:MAG: hypothetical protein WB607_10275 [Candidatus Acidiferrum sp.]|jgi:hypothetical protein